jgi:hypothetical protein
VRISFQHFSPKLDRRGADVSPLAQRIDSFVSTVALLYPPFDPAFGGPMTQSLTPLESLLFNIVLATLAVGLPILIVLSVRFLWDRNLNLGRSKELEKLIWQLHRIASAMEHQMSLSFPAIQPGTEEPRDLAYLKQLPPQQAAAAPRVTTPAVAAPNVAVPAVATPPVATQSVAAPSLAAAASATASDLPPAQPQPVTPQPAAQQASLPPLELREPTAAAPRAGVNSMFGL